MDAKRIAAISSDMSELLWTNEPEGAPLTVDSMVTKGAGTDELRLMSYLKFNPGYWALKGWKESGPEAILA
jgi:hypothetical protein